MDKTASGVSPGATADPPTEQSAGDRYRRFIEDHEAAWELAFAALAIAFVLIGFVEADGWVVTLEWLLTAIFAAEFFSRLAVAPSRSAYLRVHWIDVLALVPPVRGLRVLRLLRLLRLVRAFAGVGRALGSVERLAAHRGLVWLLVAWGAVMVVCSLGLYAAENGVNAAIDDPLDSLWWGLTTMTTVGYGDVTPVTAEGRLAATVLMVLGIGLYSAVTAAITSFFVAGHPATTQPYVAASIRTLAELRDEGHIDDATFQARRDELLNRL